MICYLCDLPIDLSLNKNHPDAYSDDHVPPLIFYPSEMREMLSRENRFPTLPTHKKCNNSYGDDETYFVRVLTTMVADKNEIGEELFKDFEKHAKHPRHAQVLREIIAGMSPRTSSGLYIPPGKMTVKLNREKIERIVWKIVRGLYFQNFKRVLSERITPTITRFDNTPKFTPEFQEGFLRKVVTAGSHAGVLVYRYGHYDEPINKAHIVLMRIWKSTMFLVYFHDLGCGCAECQTENREKSQ